MLSGSSEMLDNTTSFYLFNHSSLTWVATKNSAMMNVPNTIKLNFGGLWPYFYGRVFHNGSYRVGKVHVGNALYIWFGSSEIRFDSGFEVLTCSSNLLCKFLKKSSYFFQ